jgi:hypothetical protein
MLILSNHDTIELGYGFTIESAHLVDSIVTARHKLDSRIANILQSIKLQPITYWELIVEFERWGIDRTRGNELILTLNSIGALKIKHAISTVQERGLIAVRAMSLKTTITPLQHRDKTCFYSLARSLIRSTTYLLLLWCFAFNLVIAAGFISIPYFLMLSAGAYTTLLVSLICYEYSHIRILGKGGQDTSVVIRKGWRIGILHQQQSARKELSSALIGPLFGALASLILCLALNQITYEPIWLSIGCIFAGCHLLSLLPNFGDGWSIIRALKQGGLK